MWDRVFEPVRPAGPQVLQIAGLLVDRPRRPQPGQRPGSTQSELVLVQRKYDYRRRLPHIQKDNRPLFITFTTAHRWQLPPLARNAILECCLRQDGNKFDLHAAVVMPDHCHLLLTPLRKSDGWNYSLPEIMHAVKGASARRINVLLGRSGAVWQEESFDHVLRSNESLAEKVEYVCRNPVRAGLVASVGEYPWLWKGLIPTL